MPLLLSASLDLSVFFHLNEPPIIFPLPANLRQNPNFLFLPSHSTLLAQIPSPANYQKSLLLSSLLWFLRRASLSPKSDLSRHGVVQPSASFQEKPLATLSAQSLSPL